jgi:hypothetical protein
LLQLADADELPLADHLHQDAATHRCTGERFAKRACTANDPFAAT